MATISVSTQLYPFFDTKADQQAIDAAYSYAMRVYGPNVAAAMNMWLDNLHSTGRTLDQHPDGETRFDVCAITGILQDCEVCEVWDVPQAKAVKSLFAEYGGRLVGYRGHYESFDGAHSSGGVYVIGNRITGDATDSAIIDCYACANAALRDISDYQAELGYVLANSEFYTLGELQTMAANRFLSLAALINGHSV